MRTYQDLLECGEDEARRIDFIRKAISEHRCSGLYKTAVDAKLYYDGENPTINHYEKIIYDMQGRAHLDMYTANHKIASRFFGFVVDQANSYLLGNGVSFQSDAVKKRLGTPRKPFDQQVSILAENALIGGVSFGFWNLDHIDAFEITEFVPLYDEENGALASGIRFWQVDAEKPLRCTLYERDGLTEFIQRRGENMIVLQEKRPYILHAKRVELGSTEILDGRNYPDFPIVPLKNNRNCKSELCGRRNTIDALDLACSNMVNNVDEGNLIYWVLTNCGAMDDLDDAKFIENLRITHVTHVDGDDSSKAEAHSVEAPYDGTQVTIDMLQKKLYQDFQAFDASAVQAGNQTATAIKASYVPLDLKTDRFERQVTEFIGGILTLAGVDDEPTYTRSRISNTQEEMQTLMLMANYADDEYITTKALTILGDAGRVEEVLRRRASEDLDRFNRTGAETKEETDESKEEVTDDEF